MKVFDAERHCGAATNARWNGGTPCRLPKGFRTDHAGTGNCWLHGGRSPNGERHAEREAAVKALAKLGVPVGNGDPFTLLAKAVSHAEGYLEATAQLVREAAEPVEGATPPVGLEVAAELYEEAIRTGARTGKAAVDADVADRLAALDERAGALLLRFVRELLERVVPAAQRPAMEAWASSRLAELAFEYEHPVTVH
jgi:hypothetical protein